MDPVTVTPSFGPSIPRPGVVVWGLACVLVCLPSMAVADRTRVFRLSSADLPRELTDAPGVLAEALADSIEADRARLSIEDAAGELRCDVEATSCLVAVARSHGDRDLVFGTIERTGRNRVRVTITKFRPSGPDRQQQSYELTGDSDEMSETLVRKAAPLIGAKPRIRTRIAKVEAQPLPLPLVRDDDSASQGRVTGATWWWIGGGVAVVGAGIGFRLSARSIANDIRVAPRDTRADFTHLTALEERGQLHARAGTALVVAGAAVALGGAVRAYVQRRSASATAPTGLALVPREDGALVSWSGVLP